MTITELIDSIKFDSNVKKIDYSPKNCSKDSQGSFLSILEVANKSYNYSSDKSNEEYSEEKLKNDHNSKKFESEYEKFYNDKFNNKKHQEISEEQNSLKESESNKNHSNKKEIFDDKNSEKENNSSEKLNENNNKKTEENQDTKADYKKDEKEPEKNQEVKTILEDKNDNSSQKTAEEKTPEATVISTENNNIAAVVENICVIASTSAATITPQVKIDDSNVNTNLMPTKEQQPQAILKKEQDVLTTKPQIASEKKLQNELTTGNENTKTETPGAEAAENPVQQVKAKEEFSMLQPKKLEVAVAENVLNKLNTVDKNEVKLPQDEKLKASSEKLSDALNNGEIKPVITNIEVKSDSSKMESGNQQKQPQQGENQSINQIQGLALNENSAPKINLQQTARFDKILESRQTQNLENSVLNQIKDKLSSNITVDKSEITIALRPDNLGKVNINIISKDGVLTAQITAENKQVKDILNKGLEILKQNLTEQGISVGKMVVQVQEPNLNNQNTNSESNLKNFENSNSNSSDTNFQSGKQNPSNDEKTSYLDNSQYKLDEELDFENDNETHESNILNTQATVVHSGKVDYKV